VSPLDVIVPIVVCLAVVIFMARSLHLARVVQDLKLVIVTINNRVDMLMCREADLESEVSQLQKMLQEEREWREEREVTAGDLAYVMNSLGVPIPTNVQKVLDEKSELFDRIMADLDALGEAG
jgi:hypothetical protein